MKYNSDERSNSQRQSARDRQCPSCRRKSALSLVGTGRGFWVKRCRYCGHLKYWSSAKWFPQGLSDETLERYRSKQ